MNHERDLREVIRRLERSNTPITRRNARRAMRQVLGAIQRNLHRKYPVIRKDGTIPKGRRAITCPICRIPVKSWGKLARHLYITHKMQANTVRLGEVSPCCWCGIVFRVGHALVPFSEGSGSVIKRLQVSLAGGPVGAFARHLSHLRDLEEHVLLHTLAQKGKHHGNSNG